MMVGLRVEAVCGFSRSSRGHIGRRWYSHISCRCTLSLTFADAGSRRRCEGGDQMVPEEQVRAADAAGERDGSKSLQAARFQAYVGNEDCFSVQVKSGIGSERIP